jgi:hypothetical protein
MRAWLRLRLLKLRHNLRHQPLKHRLRMLNRQKTLLQAFWFKLRQL